MASCSVIHSYSLLHKSLIASSFSLQRFKMGDSSYTSRNISLFTVFIQLTNCTSLKELSDGFYCRLLFSFNLFAFFFLKFFFLKEEKWHLLFSNNVFIVYSSSMFLIAFSFPNTSSIVKIQIIQSKTLLPK